MFRNLRSTLLAGSGAVLLVVSMTGLAAAATLVDDTTPATIATFEDLNGNGIDDDCETAVIADAAAATVAVAAVDGNADGVISTTEAAHSSWVGGANCNHGGYVSMVAPGAAGACDTTDASEPTTDAVTETKDGSEVSDRDSEGAANLAGAATTPATTGSDCPAEAPDAETNDAAPAPCPVAPVVAGAAPMTHVQIAQSDMVGGKNCNHGGAVSASSKAANAERKAARDAARGANVHGKGAKHGKGHGHNH